MASPAYRPRMGTYSRLSVAADDANTSLVGQGSTLDDVAAREGFDIILRREDNGKSGGKERANAIELLDALRDGTIDVLGVASFDRWTRMGIADAAKIIEVVTDRNNAAKRGRGRPALFIAEREGIRSDVEGWELRIAFAADIARMERERIAARQVASRARLSEARRWAGGTVPFGYRPVAGPAGGRVLVPAPYEAAVVTSIVEAALRGSSIVAIAQELTAQGVALPRSPWRRALITEGAVPSHDRDLTRGTWTGAPVRRLLRSEHLLGRVTHKGRTLDAYEPIIDLETHQRLLARFPGAGTAQPRRRWSRLLSGLLFCDGCGSKLYPVVSPSGTTRYRCAATAVGATCPHPGTGIDADALDAHVGECIARRVGHLDELERVEVRNTSTARLAEVREAITKAVTGLSARTADRVAILAQLDQLQAEEAALEALPDTTGVSWRPTGRTVAEAWAADDLAGRRRTLTTWVSHLVVAPVGKGHAQTFDSSRVLVEWDAGAVEVLADIAS